MTVKELIERLENFDRDSEVEIYAIPKGNYLYFTLVDIDIYEDNYGTVCIEGGEE